MDADWIIERLDSCWFWDNVMCGCLCRLRHETGEIVPTCPDEPEELQSQGSEVTVVSFQGRRPAIKAAKLQTVESGKQLLTSSPKALFDQCRPRRAGRRRVKSLTDLEFDEVKGVKDLGFHFTKDDLTPRIVKLFPALRDRLYDQEDALKGKDSYFPSEWAIGSSNSLLDWGVLDSNQVVDVKTCLKAWAHTVASTVRQEC